MFDKDGSGKIDNEEVVALLKGDDLRNLVSKEAIQSAMQEIDANGDGEIDFEEFMAMMKKAAQSDFWEDVDENRYNILVVAVFKLLEYLAVGTIHVHVI